MFALRRKKEMTSGQTANSNQAKPGKKRPVVQKLTENNDNQSPIQDIFRNSQKSDEIFFNELNNLFALITPIISS